MKSFIKFSGLILVVATTFMSCGSDDDNKKEYSINTECKLAMNIKGYASHTVTEQKVEKSLKEMLNIEQRISKGELYISESTSLKITGLQDGMILTDFKLTMNGSTRTFGDITLSNSNLYTNASYSYMQEVFNKMIKQNKLVVSMSYGLSTDILENDNVNLEIVFNGKYYYWK